MLAKLIARRHEYAEPLVEHQSLDARLLKGRYLWMLGDRVAVDCANSRSTPAL
jgi:hypothetical protein